MDLHLLHDVMQSTRIRDNYNDKRQSSCGEKRRSDEKLYVHCTRIHCPRLASSGDAVMVLGLHLLVEENLVGGNQGPPKGNLFEFLLLLLRRPIRQSFGLLLSFNGAALALVIDFCYTHTAMHSSVRFGMIITKGFHNAQEDPFLETRILWNENEQWKNVSPTINRNWRRIPGDHGNAQWKSPPPPTATPSV